MNSLSLPTGTWSFATETPAEGISFITFQHGYALSAVSDPSHQGQYRAMNLWCQAEGPGLLRMRLKPETEGWIIRYALTETTLILTNRDKVFICSRTTEGEVPPKVRALFSKGRAEMDRLEA